MDLFVIRHAIAADAEPGQDDPSRELTDEGVRKFKQVVKGVRELGWAFDRVLTSPWERAVATAALLDPVTDGPTIETDLLTEKPRAELLALIAEASSPEDRRATAVVGHEPWLSELVAWLAFSDTRHSEAIELKKGGIIWLDGTAVPGGMRMRAMLTPKILRALR
ncbi:MAG TPA: histidine phosphatase family protein [Kofleriaceae bacterium]|nr:histidine phosphatase family protein [Kofleriaceae bacterium]